MFLKKSCIQLFFSLKKQRALRWGIVLRDIQKMIGVSVMQPDVPIWVERQIYASFPQVIGAFDKVEAGWQSV